MIFAILGALLLSATGVSFLATSDAVPVEISARPAPSGAGSTLIEGESVKVTAVQDADFEIHAGAAHTDAGRLLYKIEVQPAQSHSLYVDFFWTDPLAANGALKNGYIEVALYYQVSVDTSGCGSGQFSITGIDELGDGVEKEICVARAADSNDAMAYALLTKEWAGTKLRSTVTDKHYVYLLASVTNNGANVPPGDQGQLGTLTFWLDASTRS
ncbi:MAG: hypothetical protein WEB13_09495 [Dehalococcoidia bacterium]